MRRIAALLAAAVVCGCTAQVPVRPAPASQGPSSASQGPAAPVQPDVSRFLTGAAASSAAAFEAETGVRPLVVEHYVQPGMAFSPSFAGSSVPLIQVQPFHVPLERIVAGAEDGWLRSFAAAAAAWRRPVIMGFAPEMNGTWYPWGLGHVSSALYVAAWRHVVSVFRAQGALNVTWLWTVNREYAVAGTGTGTGTGTSRHVAAVTAWWPGKSWVSWTGIDGYFYTSLEDFASLFGPTIAAVRKLGRPVLISETAASPAAGKAGKIQDLFAGAYADHLLGLVWFDLKGNRDWQLQDDPAALSAFRAAVKRYG